ncbi:hypothetical protein J6590_072917 [Homalodisca vitripennis]|nr:hypothetical protein J6590_072917 [Homalodisca vitripennis]
MVWLMYTDETCVAQQPSIASREFQRLGRPWGTAKTRNEMSRELLKKDIYHVPSRSIVLVP